MLPMIMWKAKNDENGFSMPPEKCRIVVRMNRSAKGDPHEPAGHRGRDSQGGNRHPAQPYEPVCPLDQAGGFEEELLNRQPGVIAIITSRMIRSGRASRSRSMPSLLSSALRTS